MATDFGQMTGWNRTNRRAGLIGAAVRAVIVLAAWGVVANRRSSTHDGGLHSFRADTRWASWLSEASYIVPEPAS